MTNFFDEILVFDLENIFKTEKLWVCAIPRKP